MRRKTYIKPVINKIELDNIISLQMDSEKDAPSGGSKVPRAGDGSKSGNSEPFASPFGDKPYN